MAYLIATDLLTGADPAPLASINPAASTGVAVVSMMLAASDNATVAARCRLSRATGAATPTAITPDKTNSLSAAAASACATDWGTPPSVSGNPIIVLGKINATANLVQRRWITPNPRYPIFTGPSGSTVYMDEPGEGTVNAARNLCFGESDAPGALGVGRYRGRRGTLRCGFFVQDGSGGFGGVSTAPKNRGGSQGYRYTNALEWCPPVFPDAQEWLNLLNATSGTLYTQDVLGGITPAGALAKQTGKVLAGTAASAGALVKQAGKVLTGAAASAGALAKRTAKTFAGSIASAGVLAASKTVLVVLTGAIAAAGTLAKSTGKVLTGAASSAGALVKSTGKVLVGAATPSGVLAASKTALVVLTGAIAAAGSLLKRTGKGLAGGATPSGALQRQTGKSLSGAVAASGGLSKLIGKGLDGAIAVAGGLSKRIGKALEGVIAFVGGLVASGGTAATTDPPGRTATSNPLGLTATTAIEHARTTGGGVATTAGGDLTITSGGNKAGTT